MKKFMVTFKNLNNGLILDTLFNADDISEALFRAERLCKKFEKHDITLIVTSICEIKEILR